MSEKKIADLLLQESITVVLLKKMFRLTWFFGCFSYVFFVRNAWNVVPLQRFTERRDDEMNFDQLLKRDSYT